MTNETPKIENGTIYYLYRIINSVNNKIYIGQTVQPSKRWNQHKNAAAHPVMIISHAIKKYGVHNFEFEIIASCKTQDNANSLETLLVEQYQSHISMNKGYNVSLGGNNAPKTEAFRQSMRDWHASLSPEERAIISKKQSEVRKGIEYSEETLQKMSQAKLGIKLSEEHKKNISKTHPKFWLGKSLHENTRKAVIQAIIITTAEQEAEILKKFKSGLSQSKLAQEYNFSRSVIKRIIGKETNSYKKILRKFGEDIEIEIINLFLSGLGSKHLGKIYGCDKSTILRIVKRRTKISNNLI